MAVKVIAYDSLATHNQNLTVRIKDLEAKVIALQSASPSIRAGASAHAGGGAPVKDFGSHILNLAAPGMN
jgi:hypothetical protein